MWIAKCFGLSLVWATGIVLTLVSIYKNHPVLISLRGPGTVVLLATSVVVIALLSRWGFWRRAGFAGWWLVLLWCLPPLSILSARDTFEDTRRGVLQTEAKLARNLGRHFMVLSSTLGS